MLLPPSLNETGVFLHGAGEKEIANLIDYAMNALPEEVPGVFSDLDEEEIYDIIVDGLSRMPPGLQHSKKIEYLFHIVPALAEQAQDGKNRKNHLKNEFGRVAKSTLAILSNNCGGELSYSEEVSDTHGTAMAELFPDLWRDSGQSWYSQK